MSVILHNDGSEPLRLRLAYLLRDDKILYVSLRPQSKIDAEIYTNDGVAEHFERATVCWDFFNGAVTGIEVMSTWFTSSDPIEHHYPLDAATGKALGSIKRDGKFPLQDLSITLYQGAHIAIRFAKGSPAEVVSLGKGGFLILDETNHVQAIAIRNIELRNYSANNDKSLKWG